MTRTADRLGQMVAEEHGVRLAFHPHADRHVETRAQVDRFLADAEDLAFGRAVAMGAGCEPPAGRPDVPSVVEALAGLGRELSVVVEQDMYPLADFDAAEQIATRTRDYLRSTGIGA